MIKSQKKHIIRQSLANFAVHPPKNRLSKFFNIKSLLIKLAKGQVESYQYNFDTDDSFVVFFSCFFNNVFDNYILNSFNSTRYVPILSLLFFIMQLVAYINIKDTIGIIESAVGLIISFFLYNKSGLLIFITPYLNHCFFLLIHWLFKKLYFK